MILKILYMDGRKVEIPCTRVFLIGSIYLYYEQHADVRGKGTKVPMVNVKAWEVEAVPVGGSQNLVL